MAFKQQSAADAEGGRKMGRAPRIVTGARTGEGHARVMREIEQNEARGRPSALLDEHEQILVRPGGPRVCFKQASDSGCKLMAVKPPLNRDISGLLLQVHRVELVGLVAV